MGIKNLDLVSIPSVEFDMGSSRGEVESLIDYWGSRLNDSSYFVAFRDWILEESHIA